MMIRELRLEAVVAGSNFALPSYSVGAFNDRESTLIERAVSSVFFLPRIIITTSTGGCL